MFCDIPTRTRTGTRTTMRTTMMRTTTTTTRLAIGAVGARAVSRTNASPPLTRRYYNRLTVNTNSNDDSIRMRRRISREYSSSVSSSSVLVNSLVTTRTNNNNSTSSRNNTTNSFKMLFSSFYNRRRGNVRAYAASGSSSKKKGDGEEQNAKKNKDDVVKDEDIAWEESDDDEEEESEIEIEDIHGEDINVVYAEYDEKDISGGNIDTANTSWGDLCLECVRQVLQDEKNLEEFEGYLRLFAFKAIPSTKRCMISIDDLDDKFGSPTLDDLIAVSRKLNELAELKGFPDDVAIEVASPGAERKLTIPEDLLRFRELKMKVIYNDDESKNAENETIIVNVDDIEEENGLVIFKLADVQENRPPKKGMPMSKKKKEWRKNIKFTDISSANLFIDVNV